MQHPEPRPHAADPFALVGTVLENKFRVERFVAEGGFGVVYRGVHLALHRPVAIKVLRVPDELSEAARAAFVESFAREARTLGAMDHPGVVRAFDFGVAWMPTGVAAPWVALEWLEGETLEAHLRARRGRGGRAPAEVLALLRPALEALAHAHAGGVAHRDVKPANVMVVRGPRGAATLKVMDFGIAKEMGADERAGHGATRTRAAFQAFSPAYAAPEQVAGTRTGPWTDVHAMALIVTEALIDAPAYRAQGAAEIFSEVLSPWRPTPGLRGLDVGAWELVLARALALRPADRYADAGELLAALEDALPGARAAVATAQSASPGALAAATVAVRTPTTTRRGSVVAVDARRRERSWRASLVAVACGVVAGAATLSAVATRGGPAEARGASGVSAAREVATPSAPLAAPPQGAAQQVEPAAAPRVADGGASARSDEPARRAGAPTDLRAGAPADLRADPASPGAIARPAVVARPRRPQGGAGGVRLRPIAW